METGINKNFYVNLRNCWQKAYPLNNKLHNDRKAQEWYSRHKGDKGAVAEKIAELEVLIKSKPRNPVAECYARGVKRRVEESLPSPVEQGNSANEIEVVSVDEPVASSSVPPTIQQPQRKLAECPKQNQYRDEMLSDGKKIRALLDMKYSGLPFTADNEADLKALKASEENKMKKLKRLKSLQTSQQKSRGKKKAVLEKVKELHPAAAADLSKLDPQPCGRPRLERDQPALLKSIIELVTPASAADGKRSSEKMECFLTLDELLKELHAMGFTLSRSALYLRLLPRNPATREGQRHVVTVPVKMMRAENDLRKGHEDDRFAKATIKYLHNLAVIMGPDLVCVISQDDKAKVPLGLPAAKKQGPILMKLDYQIRLPDHDFVVASRHKLIPSVSAKLEIKDNAVSYSGATYIAIRSGRHDSSTAPRHADDLHRLLMFILMLAPGIIGHVPPILILLVDGGPDESPKHEKTLRFAAMHFRRFNLDAMYVATHAPGQSANNPVERRMAPLSRDLCGLILPFDSYGSHLNASGKTVNVELERKNFQRAGELLAGVWGDKIIDGHPVICEYVMPHSNDRRKLELRGNHPSTDSTANRSATTVSTFSGSMAEDEDFGFLTETWKSQHVQQSQYLLQLVKCGDPTCCPPARTNVRAFLRNQFLPPPVPILKSLYGLKLGTLSDKEFHFMDLTTRLAFENVMDVRVKVFDQYCPSMQKKLKDKDYYCPVCEHFFVTKAGRNSHKRMHLVMPLAEDVPDPVLQVEEDSVVEDGIYIIDDLAGWLQPVFVPAD